MSLEAFQEISPADFFYRNRDIAGFTNPSRALYSTVRELVENSLDACETSMIPPDIYVRLRQPVETEKYPTTYEVRVKDNGLGVPPDVIPSAFGQVLFGSKYRLRQARGTFGLGVKMALLYGQITTHSATRVVSATIGSDKIHEYTLNMDIQSNKPIILERKVKPNNGGWHGTIVEFSTEGDYPRAMPKIIEYLRQTAIVAPYADITFVDPKGRIYRFERATSKMPKPPKETKPHPEGVDVETFKRLLAASEAKTLRDFMMESFQRIGRKTAEAFLEYAGLDPKKTVASLSPEEILLIVNSMKSYGRFLPPDASCLSPLGEELLEAGIRKVLKPEFVAVHQRPAASYSGYPFIVEVGIAYGGGIPKEDKVALLRFANKIPLLFDEASDVSWKVVNSLDWRRYKITMDMPIAVITHLCSTKIPYKTVGKEYIADRPEIEREILCGLREVARRLSTFISKRRSVELERKRLNIFLKYLPKLASFSTRLAGKKEEPDIKKLLRKVSRLVPVDEG
ncbi:MAG: DNA topoisomerase VI subunit B [Candidatus Bathyarchaeia archaeon]|nr:DNA topoisomerase VI subunit B [Candidatus Bathyarchaeota archaeon]